MAWTVWVHPGDEATAAVLAESGHRLDGRPMLMAAPLEELDLAPRAELDLDPEPAWRTVALLNDAAYGIPPEGSFAAALADPIAPEWRVRVARVDGRPAACAAVLVDEANVWVGLVATAPEAQGRGLCSELLRGMLSEAKEAGAETTSLEGSAMGEPVYARLGYRSLGHLQMWERRTF